MESAVIIFFFPASSVGTDHKEQQSAHCQRQDQSDFFRSIPLILPYQIMVTSHPTRAAGYVMLIVFKVRMHQLIQILA